MMEPPDSIGLDDDDPLRSLCPQPVGVLIMDDSPELILAPDAEHPYWRRSDGKGGHVRCEVTFDGFIATAWPVEEKRDA